VEVGDRQELKSSKVDYFLIILKICVRDLQNILYMLVSVSTFSWANIFSYVPP
jgi:hypothetical protein